MAGQWRAKWIGPAYDPRKDLGVFVFRRRIDLATVPDELLVRVSADNRYKLYVNEQLVEFGPQRGDEKHWFYETVDLAPYLKQGANVVWALVWNFGWMAPMAQITVRTGFVLEGEGISTPSEWECAPVEGWTFEMMHSNMGWWYIDVGPGEVIDGRDVPCFRKVAMQDNLRWSKPNTISSAEERGANGGGTPWNLIPRSIPPMRYELRSDPAQIRDRQTGTGTPLAGTHDLAAGGTLLLDFQELLCAYPRITLRGTEGAKVRLTYAESMWDGQEKRSRNDVVGLTIQGYQDEFVLGATECVFEPLWWRTFRYVEIQSDQPVQVESVAVIVTGYPLEVESSFTASDPVVEQIFNVGVRTLERCMGESYFDCPYYEQLQYAGDTRIQALLTYYLTRDRDLPRNAIETLAWSLMENGLTQSRYPSRQPQVIPPFSLWWLVMIRDQVFYDRVPPYDNVQRAKIQAVLNATERMRQRPDEAFWNFADWVPEWPGGVPPSGPCSTVHRLTWFYALTAHLQAFNTGSDATTEAARQMLIRRLNGEFYTRKDLICHEDDADWAPSEHAEALYRLCQRALGCAPSAWPAEALEAAKAAKCTLYFSFYKHLAMQPANFMDLMGPWRTMLDHGLSTFAEKEEPTRSDCHAWSAHPLLGFFQQIAGVTSVAPGWAKARIAPSVGELDRFEARIAHPDGTLIVAYDRSGLSVETPVASDLVWEGEVRALEPGYHQFKGSGELVR